MKKYTIELPLPGEHEHPNARSNTWHKKAKAVAESRGTAFCMTRLMMRREKVDKPIENAMYSVQFALPRKQDQDNLTAWIKAQIDGIASAGLIKSDGKLTQHSLEQKSGFGATGGKFGVTFTFWDADTVG